MSPRNIEQKILDHIHSDKIILVVGARQVGKTTVLKKIYSQLENQGNEVFFFNLEKTEYLESFNKDPDNLLFYIGKSAQKRYVFIDEIQYLKNPTNFLKYIFDEYKGSIKLIVSGSSSFYIDTHFKDSLAGRKVLFEMYSMDFYEFLLCKGELKLAQCLIDPEYPRIYKKNLLLLYHEYMIYGGYPDVVLAPSIQKKKECLEEIAMSYIKKDISEAKIEYQEKYFYLLKILASQVGNLLNLHELANTIHLPVSTVENYVYIMRKSFHIATIKPFYKNIRKELTKMPKVYFFDTGLRNYFVNDFNPFEGRIDKGALLENLVFKNFLSSYSMDGIQFWRTQNKNEIDFVLPDGSAYEVKSNMKSFEKKKYSHFMKYYPDISFDCIDFEKSLEVFSTYAKRGSLTKT